MRHVKFGPLKPPRARHGGSATAIFMRDRSGTLTPVTAWQGLPLPSAVRLLIEELPQQDLARIRVESRDRVLDRTDLMALFLALVQPGSDGRKRPAAA
jgi:hypothetical protein